MSNSWDEESLVFPSLIRPEYPPSPEAFLSALAWSTAQRGDAPKPGEAIRPGLIYERHSNRTLKNFSIRETHPALDEASTQSFVDALVAGGFPLGGPAATRLRIARAVADALVGTTPENGVGSPSAAFGFAAALLQDPVGCHVKAGPPNFSSLIETMYVMGAAAGAADAAHRLASDAWFAAASMIARQPASQALEGALNKTSLKAVLDPDWASQWPPTTRREPGRVNVPRWWVDAHRSANYQTPFRWFHLAWTRICSEPWVIALPPRRWAGWATCIMRHAIAFTYLWEANFFVELARGAIDGALPPGDAASRAIIPQRPLVPWLRGSITEMDVKPALRKQLKVGLLCRAELLRLIPEAEQAALRTLADVVGAMRKKVAGDPACRARLLNAIGGNETPDAGYRNLKFTVEYALLDRSTDNGGSSDGYSMLRAVSKRFAHVSPGADWIVVMAAVNASRPEMTVRLGDMAAGLMRLGLHPRLDFLTEQLERAGLCASAADGDEGIVIDLGFGGNP